MMDIPEMISEVSKRLFESDLSGEDIARNVMENQENGVIRGKENCPNFYVERTSVASNPCENLPVIITESQENGEDHSSLPKTTEVYSQSRKRRPRNKLAKNRDELLLAWYLKAQAEGNSPDSKALKSKALEIGRKLGMYTNFTASDPWLNRWRRQFVGKKSSKKRKFKNSRKQNVSSAVNESTQHGDDRDKNSVNKQSDDLHYLYRKARTVDRPIDDTTIPSEVLEVKSDDGETSSSKVSPSSIKSSKKVKNTDVVHKRRRRSPKYDHEKKEEIMELLKRKSISVVAKQYKIDRLILRSWKKWIKRNKLGNSLKGHSRQRKRNQTGIKETSGKDDDLLYSWYLATRSAGLAISNFMIKLKAVELHTKYGNDKEFTASDEWISEWKKLRNIESPRKSGGDLSACTSAACQEAEPIGSREVEQSDDTNVAVDHEEVEVIRENQPNAPVISSGFNDLYSQCSLYLKTGIIYGEN